MSEFFDIGGHAVVIGVSLLLGLALLVGAISRQPIDRQRSAELGVAACLLWIPLALLPLPRFLQREPGVDAMPLDTTAVHVRVETLEAAVPQPMPAPETTPRELRPSTVPQPFRESSVGPAPFAAIALDAPSTPATEVVTPSVPVDAEIRAWLIVAFQVGASLSIAWLLAGAWQLRRVLRSARPAADALSRLVPHAATRRRVRLLVVDGPCRPFCCGLLRPTIVIPSSLCDDPALRDILRHEAAHLRQRDPWSQALFAIALPLLFFHPLFWWVRARARAAAEVIADDQATHGHSRTDYARNLIDFAARDESRAPLAAVPVFRRPSDFTRRIEMLLKRQTRLAPRSSRAHSALRWGSSLAVLVVFAGTLGVTPALAQDPNRNAQLREENDRLRTELRTMRAELERLSDRMEKLAPSARAADPAAAPAPRLGGLFGQREPAPEPTPLSSVVRAPAAAAPQPPRGLPGVPAQPRISAPEAGRSSPPDAPKLSAPEFGLLSSPAPVPATDPLMGEVRNPFAGAVGQSFPQAGRTSTMNAPIEVLTIVNQIIEVEGEIEIAEARLRSAERLAAEGRSPMADMLVAKAQLRMQRRKFEVLNQLGRSELASLQMDLDTTKAELERARLLQKRGFVSEAEVSKARSQLRRLTTSVKLLSSVLPKKAKKNSKPR